MVLLLATIFVGLVVTFGVFLTYARPENIERPFMVGALTTLTGMIAAWLLWQEWHGGTGSAGRAATFALIAVSGFALGRGIDVAMGARPINEDDRQATQGAELAD